MTDELPGYRVVDSPATVAEDGLRNDVAAFLGSTERGPMNLAVRVSGRQAYAAAFGGPGTGTIPRALAAYFSNGGEVAWVVRAGRDGRPAAGQLILGDVAADGSWTGDGPRRMSFPGSSLQLAATSPGEWARGTHVRVVYRAYGRIGVPELDLTVAVPGMPALRRTGLAADELLDALASTGLVTARFSGTPGAGRLDDTSGPAQVTRTTVLNGGAEPMMDGLELREAVEIQAQVEEIALVCVPDLSEQLSRAEADDVLFELASSAAATQDRLVVASVPSSDLLSLTEWSARVQTAVADPSQRRAVALYFPYLLAESLTLSGTDRYRRTDPVGHVCGRIADLDRERGSGWSPANTLVSDAIDTAAQLPTSLQAAALDGQVNLVRPRIGGGLELWGARTMDTGSGRYIAHRRLVHRIVRAARRVAEPLVFDTNDRLLWFTVARSLSGVLLEAFRSGALQGATPDEAYRVRCDESTNPPESLDAGLVVCEIDLAPATPMEFVTLRLTIGAEGLLEVVEQ
jgi:phage tail sheath protein FI